LLAEVLARALSPTVVACDLTWALPQARIRTRPWRLLVGEHAISPQLKADMRGFFAWLRMTNAEGGGNLSERKCPCD
jgi:hypothetical protein